MDMRFWITAKTREKSQSVMTPETEHDGGLHIASNLVISISLNLLPVVGTHINNPSQRNLSSKTLHQNRPRLAIVLELRENINCCAGIFSAKIKVPAGNTSGLNCSFYLSSLEGDKFQDEIDFEFLGKDKTIIQTNVYTEGVGNREEIHQLGFDSSETFHEYAIHWTPTEILWFIDQVQVRKHERKPNDAYPMKPMFLYASVWNAGWVNNGEWAGCYVGCDEPYVCTYKDVQVPHLPDQ